VAPKLGPESAVETIDEDEIDLVWPLTGEVSHNIQFGARCSYKPQITEKLAVNARLQTWLESLDSRNLDYLGHLIWLGKCRLRDTFSQ